MKLGLLLPPAPKPGDHKWKLSRQIGINHAVAKLAPELTGDDPIWNMDSLLRSKARFEAAGFTISALEGDQMDMNRIKLGLPGRDEDIARYCQMLENMGKAGIHLLCYNFMGAVGWFRTAVAVPVRGGAMASAFRLADAETGPLPEFGEVSAEKVWENWTYFMDRVLPVAEKAGVVMAAHPDDPPIPAVRGIGRIFNSPDGFRRARDYARSPSNKITFCQSNFMLMGEPIEPLIREFAPNIAFVHFRDIKGTAEDFIETFHDDGPHDMVELLRLYHEVGFDGLIRPDHVPNMEGEYAGSEGGALNLSTTVGYEIQGRLFAVGYIKGMAEALGIRME
ncbi:mannonate dehydratase [Aliiruegeria haliotis]|uniref:mannonate dehydratase n=1 Tax=Aliiruegeria haliotis TaxID=1280846 RepID=A0A2T0RDU2_9RHOB|nr:mannonate dehydratase [Aliiruegeria haliotis]PRY19337.1 mannonate dehydratase [Aliiruegeria haliotis]